MAVSTIPPLSSSPLVIETKPTLPRIPPPEFVTPRGWDHSARTCLASQRILVVDDFRLYLDSLSEQLAFLLDPPFSASITLASSPEQAFELWQAAEEKGEPFSLLISDLAMESTALDGKPLGYNGDELLQKMAQTARSRGWQIPPTVFNSGTHAQGIQTFAFHSLEGIRRSSILSERVGGEPSAVPITLVLKTEPLETLLNACEMVLLMRERIQPQRYTDHIVRDWRVYTVESTPEFEILAQMHQVGALVAEKLGRILEYCMEHRFPEFYSRLDLESYRKNIRRFYEDFSFEKLLAPGDEGSCLRHKFKGLVPILLNFGYILKLQVERNPAEAEHKSFAVKVHAMLEEMRKYFLYLGNLNSKGSNAPTSLADILSATLKGIALADTIPIRNTVPDEKRICCNEKALGSLLEQPIMNAMKFAPRPDGQVSLEISEVKLSDAPEDVRKHFEHVSAQGTSAESIIQFCVIDNGPGIPEADRLKVFEGYSTSPDGGGWGLAFLKKELPRYHGTCHVQFATQGEKPTGTRFSVYVPAV